MMFVRKRMHIMDHQGYPWQRGEMMESAGTAQGVDVALPLGGV